MARVVWITGLPGSGKTTLAKLLRNELKNIGELCVLIDGDEIRSILGNELGYDRRTRESLANIYQNFIEFFIHQDISVIVSTVSLFHGIHKSNREKFQNYFEIFLDVEHNIRASSGRSWLYSSTQEIPGLDQEIELPINPDLVLTLDSPGYREHWVKIVLEKLKV